jgi:acetyl-CoA C-acetyltransferase
MRHLANTPVIIGAGQSVDRIDAPDYHRWSASALAAEAARAALADTQVGSVIAERIDAVATTRTFEDSYAQPALFGKSDNFPRSVAARLGIAPHAAIWSKGGGQSPQDLVSEFCERVAAGEFELVLLCGGEAISTTRHARRSGLSVDFAESPGGTVEDRGAGFEEFHEKLAARHGVVNATIGYALAENARRARLGVTRAEYAAHMGRLFAPFAAIAHANPRAAWDVPAYTPTQIVEPTPSNRWVADPYPLRVVARDQVNLGAAVLIASARVACDLGIDPDRMVYLHGYAQATEKLLLSRPDMGASPAAQSVSREALMRAGITVADLAAFDFYSCFPIAVSNVAIDAFAIEDDDPRKLTVTGGLPFFGGPGNNYSMHAIAEMVQRLRTMPGQPGFIGANGGYLSKYSAGVYSTMPRAWRSWPSDVLQNDLDLIESITPLSAFSGEGTIETYTVTHKGGKPHYAVIIGRTGEGERFIARSADDGETAHIAHRDDVLARSASVTTDNNINLFRFV